MTHPAPAPFSYVRGDSFYFVDPQGEHWRVRDALYLNSRHLVLPLCSSRAAYRVFSPREGTPRVYFFKARELRGTRVSHLVRQLRESGEVGVIDPALRHDD